MTVGEFMLFGVDSVPSNRLNNLSHEFEWNPVSYKNEKLSCGQEQGRHYNVMLANLAESYGINPYR